ncbi:terminase small subunit [Hymenobacter sp. YC55]|uniref:terminase small subunit n=1 Tax=Hymenobacter sp. YC55 TaxID=3034019 RepID=UPI0023F7A5B9|nr:terminase small subunit [Hymenobacter sp. YC55]MDF7810719.1 hypothetical protein [Hymenobacter sp. YC55]
MYFTYNYAITIHYHLSFFDMATGQPDETATNQPGKSLTKLQQGFAEHFARLWKGAPAYRLAGGAEKGAKQNAKNLLKDERIVAAIKEEAAKLGMTVDEATVRMSDWGRVTIDDVMTKVEYEESTTVRQPLELAIAEMWKEYQFDKEYTYRSAELLGLKGDELSEYVKDIEKRETRIKLDELRYRMRLERDPQAYRLVEGPKVKRYRMELDLVKVHDKKAGHMIKKIVPNKHGLAVELHDAKDAVNTMLKIHGAFAPVKVDHTTNGNDMPGSNIMMPDNGRD